MSLYSDAVALIEKTIADANKLVDKPRLTHTASPRPVSVPALPRK
jgi:hypothetical protein